MLEIRDRVKVEILKAIVESEPEEIVSAILSIPELAIVDRDAELSRNHWENEDMQRGWDIAQKVMVKGGWVKEV